ncbi:aryl-alcohol dehydrogenase-like predicted oxidoreductase [Stackebrandtia albiflava]|uniref:Aryl-alcohol dehydrogenase-like predicted oxidoreductase n=1 Tax=Stackebrandtia albiflava TaxID=406432 RepID=A0A562UL15_9ACTN|nr:aldo/keto reductase [Stackebrandtia albiflava]TWJ06307.1 aryl-alcohol dehydrogenase-like predicted oxidoreductase [Stackebrandtia albiflava]
MPTPTFRVGGEHEVRRLGFGAMHLPTGPADRDESRAVARRAVELGVELIDTAYMYGGGANEELLAEALHPYPANLLVTTKVGVEGSGPPADWRLDGRPHVLRAQVDNALRRLRVERLELLQLHRVDPEVPLDDQVGALALLREDGKIGHIGLSEVSVSELSRARAITPIASVQNRYHLFDREHEPVLAACEAADIAFLPWRPIAHGKAGADPDVTAVAAELGATPTQVCLAWLLARSPVVLPIPGTARRAHLEENVAAARFGLTTAQFDRLDRLGRPTV